jgi:predicted DNA-binding protein
LDVDKIVTILYTKALEEVDPMASATVRISVKAKETLKKLAEQTGKKMQTVLDEAIESYRRQQLLEEANAAFAALRADKEAWEAEQEERAAWDVTLEDGLTHD